MPLHVETPLVRSTALSDVLGTDVWLKMEAAQPAGSFKQRGMGALVEEAVNTGASRVVTSSGGNAGLAVAVCCRAVGMPCVVVVPRRTGALMKDRIAAEGAEVIVHGEVWDDAHAHAEILAGEGGFLVHPFDHPAVWRGNATLIHEVVDRMPKPGSVVVSVGGGGLLLGVLQGLREVGWEDVPVFGVETHGAASLAAALEAGALVTLPDISSIALTLGAKTVAQEALDRSVAQGVRAVQVSDRQAVDALERFLVDHRVLVEPACGASLALVYGREAALTGPVLVVVCGGASATPHALAEWRAAVG